MWDLCWTLSEDFVERLVREGLLKRGFGEPKMEFTVPINWIEEFDIFDNLRAQDPFGLGVTGEGEQGRYYYVESVTYDFINQKMTIKAVDLQFILRQCMIVAPCGAIPFKWEDASEPERMYAYVGDCDTESFSDGEPLKLVCKCI